jgi:hypothetical protein
MVRRRLFQQSIGGGPMSVDDMIVCFAKHPLLQTLWVAEGHRVECEEKSDLEHNHAYKQHIPFFINGIAPVQFRTSSSTTADVVFCYHCCGDENQGCRGSQSPSVEDLLGSRLDKLRSRCMGRVGVSVRLHLSPDQDEVCDLPFIV